MTYETNLKKAKERNDYYNQKEIIELRKKYPKGIPFTEVIKEGEREALHEPALIHKRHELVYYKDNLAKIEKVNKNGIYLRIYKTDPKTDFATPQKKLKFVKEKDIKDNVKPSFAEDIIPVGIFSPYSFAIEKE